MTIDDIFKTWIDSQFIDDYLESMGYGAGGEMSKFKKGDYVVKKSDYTVWSVRDCWGTNYALRRKVHNDYILDNAYEDDLELLISFDKKED